MIRKPRACDRCPARKWGEHYCPDKVVGAPVTVYGQAPGGHEEKEGEPFVGPTGAIMDKHFLHRAGLARGEVNLCNTIRCRKNGSDHLPELTVKGKIDPELAQIVEHCTRVHGPKHKPGDLIISQGNYALWALTGETSITEKRGWLYPLAHPWHGKVMGAHVWTPSPSEPKVLATYHLAALLRSTEFEMPTKADWGKALRIQQGRWPKPMPEIQSRGPSVWPSLVAFDTEYVPATRHLLRYSLASAAGEVWVVEREDVEGFVIQPGTVVIMHNAVADLPFLWEMAYGQPFEVEDLMYAHALLWSGFPHDLDFVGSLYARTNRWKWLQWINLRQYAGGDSLGTVDGWRHAKSEFDRDPRSLALYRELAMPRLPMLMRAKAKGIRVHQGRAAETLADLAVQQTEAKEEVQAAVGFPIKLSSPAQVSHFLFDYARLPLPRKRR